MGRTPPRIGLNLIDEDRQCQLAASGFAGTVSPRADSLCAARFRAEGNAGPRMLWYVIRAHAALFGNLRRLWRQRCEIRERARITPVVFRRLLRSHAISARRMAAL